MGRSKDTIVPSEVAPPERPRRFVVTIHEKTGDHSILDTTAHVMLDVSDACAMLNNLVAGAR